MTKIEWTGETWNPTLGCSKVSPGCDNCYAIRFAHRGMTAAHRGLTAITDHGPDWTGEVRCLAGRLDIPLRRRQPTPWFVGSMSDLFHPQVPDDFIYRVWTKMAVTPWHTYQILTKRPQRMATWMRQAVQRWGPGVMCVLPNVWLGTSIESDRYTWRANHLRQTPAAIHWLSLEPLLGPLPSLDLTGIDWVVAGGESGPVARPMHPDWVRDIRDRCVQAHIPFLFKQWGQWSPLAPLDKDGQVDWSGGHPMADDGMLYQPGDLTWPNGPRRNEALHARHNHLTAMYRLGKKAAGRELDGQTWHQFPGEKVSS